MADKNDELAPVDKVFDNITDNIAKKTDQMCVYSIDHQLLLVFMFDFHHRAQTGLEEYKNDDTVLNDNDRLIIEAFERIQNIVNSQKKTELSTKSKKSNISVNNDAITQIAELLKNVIIDKK